MTTSSLRIAAVLAALALFSNVNSSTAGDVPDQPGSWNVGHTQTTMIDADRADRSLLVDIWYPVTDDDFVGDLTRYMLAPAIFLNSAAAIDDVAVLDQGELPLVVFSHGFGGINIQSVRLMEHLASHGFVVAAPSHTGNTQLDTSSPDPEADRYPDIAFVIDEMERFNTNGANAFFGKVDTDNVGVAGHSYGGMTAMFMAAGHAPFGPDTRVKAIMPVAASSNQLTDGELAGITVPTLLMVGTLDGLQGETARAYGLIDSSPDLFRVDVIGGNHTHFANVCDIGNVLLDLGLAQENWGAVGAGALIPIYNDTCVPPAFSIEEATRIQNLYAAAHFRRYLLGETYYDRYLTPAYAGAREADVNYFGVTTPELDHFMCYKAKRSKGAAKSARVDVALSDTFATDDAQVRRARSLCVPADNNDEGIGDDCSNLVGYSLKGARVSVPASVVTTDQFGVLTLDLGKAERLLVPASQELDAAAGPVGDSLDHFRCYDVRIARGTEPFAKGVSVSVADQFENRTYELKKPRELCVPTAKDSQGVIDNQSPLLCYAARASQGEPRHGKVQGRIQTADNFGARELDTVVESLFCVPASLDD